MLCIIPEKFSTILKFEIQSIESVRVTLEAAMNVFVL